MFSALLSVWVAMRMPKYLIAIKGKRMLKKRICVKIGKNRSFLLI